MAKHGGIKDKGAYFVIDPLSRKIIVPHAHKSIGVVGDHNSEQIMFECPQIIDGHDVSQCESRYITWVNVEGEKGNDRLQIEQVEQGTEGMIYLSWTIRNALTVAKGVVQFSIHFEDADGNRDLSYRWSTATCKDCEILDGINAVLGTYKAIYVAGDTLVIADYTPVADNTLALESKGIIPEGAITLKANGTHDVGQYALAIVDVAPDDESMFETPTITVQESGRIIASANGKFKTEKLGVIHDYDFIPENIKYGINIFGLRGTYVPKIKDENVEMITGSIAVVNHIDGWGSLEPIFLEVKCIGSTDESKDVKFNNVIRVEEGHPINVKVIKSVQFTIVGRQLTNNMDVNCTVDCSGATFVGTIDYASDGYPPSTYIVEPWEDNFTITIKPSVKG